MFPLPRFVHRSFIPAIAWFLIATALLCMPGSNLPKEDWLDKIYFDKWAHIGVFGLMVLLFCAPIRNRSMRTHQKKKAFANIAMLGITYGILIEFIQLSFIPHRAFDVWDIAADIIGCIAAYIWAMKRFIKKIGPDRNRGRNQN
jgi:VanZ family protein